MGNPKRQHWILLGSAPASEELWGIRHINFPCGYFMPTAAFAQPGKPIIRPAPGIELMALGGFAIEISQGGKNAFKDKADFRLAGYRPWLALYYASLLDELQKRHHTITVWDKGIAIFYGLWQEACQALGELISADAIEDFLHLPVKLETPTGTREGVPIADYNHDAASIIRFMSEFMTLSAGDIYVQGPLVAQKIGADIAEMALVIGEYRFGVKIT